ncbi:EpsG family protein [Pseudomonas sp. EYE_354]|uniref:EpsG family protein n=1 Tax=Pseudomonas sp. EYE_354 TaxID=2853449 RepID=UPI002002E095|nr:EpsG family protein [Pseudomonas sp. EYE_354]MCK6186793.1 EpsG family protein [Pseudomonas sp. EYE_354]
MAFILTSISGYRTSIFLYVVVFVFLLMSFFRGLVGTDTYAYEIIVGHLSGGPVWTGMEPGFVLISWLLLEITGDASVTVRILGLLVFCALFIYIYRSNKLEKFLLVSYILPAFIYQYSMNGLRVGIAAMMILLATQELRQDRAVRGVGLATASLFFHYSTLVSMVLLWASKIRWARTQNILIVPLAVLLALCFFIFNESYFYGKINSYQGFESPSSFSGLGKILTLLVLVSGVFMSNLARADKAKLLLLGLGSTLIFWFVSTISYAGLRFLDLLSFAYPLCILVVYNSRKLEFGRFMKITLVVAGLLAALMSYRNFINEEGQGPSPFLPYHLKKF